MCSYPCFGLSKTGFTPPSQLLKLIIFLKKKTDTASQPIMKSVAKTASLPMQKSAAKTASLPMQKSAAKTTSLPMLKSAAKTASLPIMKSAAKTESSFHIYIYIYIYIHIFSLGCLHKSEYAFLTVGKGCMSMICPLMAE